jgi:hypothetical protein
MDLLYSFTLGEMVVEVPDDVLWSLSRWRVLRRVLSEGKGARGQTSGLLLMVPADLRGELGCDPLGCRRVLYSLGVC